MKSAKKPIILQHNEMLILKKFTGSGKVILTSLWCGFG
jgi:hypothetical protein